MHIVDHPAEAVGRAEAEQLVVEAEADDLADEAREVDLNLLPSGRGLVAGGVEVLPCAAVVGRQRHLGGFEHVIAERIVLVAGAAGSGAEVIVLPKSQRRLVAADEADGRRDEVADGEIDRFAFEVRRPDVGAAVGGGAAAVHRHAEVPSAGDEIAAAFIVARERRAGPAAVVEHHPAGPAFLQVVGPRRGDGLERAEGVELPDGAVGRDVAGDVAAHDLEEVLLVRQQAGDLDLVVGRRFRDVGAAGEEGIVAAGSVETHQRVGRFVGRPGDHRLVVGRVGSDVGDDGFHGVHLRGHGRFHHRIVDVCDADGVAVLCQVAGQGAGVPDVGQDEMTAEHSAPCGLGERDVDRAGQAGGGESRLHLAGAGSGAVRGLHDDRRRQRIGRRVEGDGRSAREIRREEADGIGDQRGAVVRRGAVTRDGLQREGVEHDAALGILAGLGEA